MASFFKGFLGPLFRYNNAQVYLTVSTMFMNCRGVRVIAAGAVTAGNNAGAGQEERKSSLIIDQEHYKIVCPVAGGGSYNLSNCIPSVVGHTSTGYTFRFKKAQHRLMFP